MRWFWLYLLPLHSTAAMGSHAISMNDKRGDEMAPDFEEWVGGALYGGD